MDKSYPNEMIDASMIPKLITIIRKTKLSFPYGKYFIDPKQMVGNLHEYLRKNRIFRNEEYDVRDAEKTIPPLEVTLNGKYFLHIPSQKDYERINQLPCFFMDESRLQSYRIGNSFVYGWENDDNFLSALLLDLVENKKRFCAKELREMMYSGKHTSEFRNKYTECAHEPITFICGVIKTLMNPSNVRMLDACAGWGDRLLSCILLKTKEYVGVEPNSLSFPLFNKMAEYFDSSHTILHDGFPSVKLPNRMYNIVWFSPPAYDAEFYSNDSNQSIVMFRDKKEWLNEFLYKTIDILWNRLEVGGYFVIQSLLARIINNRIRSQEHAHYFGAVSMKTGQKRNKPLWIWTKRKE